MSSRNVRWLIVALVVAVAVGAGTAMYLQDTTQDEKIAIKGYDPVAYFVEGRPVEGSPDFEYVWQDARWRFASAENRDLFASAPERYSPQYGGFCALGVAYGFGVDIDPEVWTIVDGRLYLNSDMEAREEFLGDLAGNIAHADSAWSKVAAAN
jgi:hypothetical protein